MILVSGAICVSKAIFAESGAVRTVRTRHRARAAAARVRKKVVVRRGHRRIGSRTERNAIAVIVDAQHFGQVALHALAHAAAIEPRARQPRRTQIIRRKCSVPDKSAASECQSVRAKQQRPTAHPTGSRSLAGSLGHRHDCRNSASTGACRSASKSASAAHGTRFANAG